ncbi:hypothetical protein METBIDRAFT_10483 [Metschnikowia bicuspidata var. bicuspidata NRRL YB-4993]|uniref:Outer spore wall protein RRT8 n=1 Tax=Metschnikowia bicuspidata var. bicuspidata NRRL YB-4993 TaxID=869754 RepID=A0A1A0HKB8_9ASCO|nr:hypothetical protein METBIDRAFT_10483 [Metschnikowia bicuspidata var. bicuspidata NRRL YB-4993]OBA24332.1 hypothetical protein METBIDRAFT_10483 [Metschnikowia bicuspidata var. bicuspidata NRRL YB-4993]
MIEEKKCNWKVALSDACFNNSFMAPFKGIQYFANDSQLWMPFLAICVPSALILILVFSTLLITVFPPYLAMVVMVTGPFGFISAFITLLDVTRRITVTLLQFLFMRRIQASIFERVLTNEGAAEIVARYTDMRGRTIHDSSLEFRLCNQTLPFLLREILYTILGIIPLIGPLVVLIAKAPIKGYKAHKHYFKLEMWDHAQINHFFKKYHSDYTSFGFIALILEMIPAFTICFMYTNNIGIALWTAKYHRDFEEFISREATRPEGETEGLEFWGNSVENSKKGQGGAEKTS